MSHINVARSAMSLGAVFAAWSALWVLLIGLGWAEEVLAFVLQLHFIRFGYELTPYSAVTGISSIALSFCAGALLGAIFALVWNSLTVASESTSHDTKSVAAE